MILRPWYRSPLLILLAVFLLQWLLLFSIREPTWDAVSYYVYARSVVFDGDLQFENDYQLSYPTAGEHFASKALDQVNTAAGRVANLFAIGTALFWLPWLMLLRMLSPLLLADATSLTGYERFFVSNLATLSAFFGLLALLLAYKVAENLTNRWLALASAATLTLATPLLYYQFREPMYSHATSALVVSLCVFVWWKQNEAIGSVWQAMGLGLLIGMAGLVRWQNLAYVLLPLVSTFMLWWKHPARRSRRVWGRALSYMVLVGLATVAVLSLQMAVWQVLYGSFLTIPQGDAFIDWRAPFLLPFLFSSFRGVLPWMPVFFLVLVGLLALSKQHPQAGLPLLFMLLVAVYINGSTRDWFAGGGYGPRRLTSEFIILVVGYAAFLKLIPQRIRGWGSVLLGIGLALHQWILLRFALPEGLGGRVMSMAPTFYWEDVSLTQFFTDFSSLALRAGQRPFDYLIFPGSPLDIILRTEEWPIQHLSTLLATGMFLLPILAGMIVCKYRLRIKLPGSLVLTVMLILIGLADLWVLLSS